MHDNLTLCVLLKHFNCERPPDCRTNCKIHVYCKTISCDWYTKTELNRTTVSIGSNWTEPGQNSNWTDPNPYRTYVSGFDSNHYFWACKGAEFIGKNHTRSHLH